MAVEDSWLLTSDCMYATYLPNDTDCKMASTTHTLSQARVQAKLPDHGAAQSTVTAAADSYLVPDTIDSPQYTIEEDLLPHRLSLDAPRGLAQSP